MEQPPEDDVNSFSSSSEEHEPQYKETESNREEEDEESESESDEDVESSGDEIAPNHEKGNSVKDGQPLPQREHEVEDQNSPYSSSSSEEEGEEVNQVTGAFNCTADDSKQEAAAEGSGTDSNEREESSGEIAGEEGLPQENGTMEIESEVIKKIAGTNNKANDEEEAEESEAESDESEEDSDGIEHADNNGNSGKEDKLQQNGSKKEEEESGDEDGEETGNNKKSHDEEGADGSETESDESVEGNGNRVEQKDSNGISGEDNQLQQNGERDTHPSSPVEESESESESEDDKECETVNEADEEDQSGEKEGSSGGEEAYEDEEDYSPVNSEDGGEAEEENENAVVAASSSQNGTSSQHDGGEEEQPRKLFERIWGQNDEIKFLKTLMELREGLEPLENLSDHWGIAQQNLNKVFSRAQILDKFKRLKTKFRNKQGKAKNGKDPVISNQHEKKMYMLSKKIWGDEIGIDVDATKETARVESNLTYVEWNMADAGRNKEILKRGFHLIEDDKRLEIEGRWKKLRMDEMELSLRRASLINEQVKLSVDAYRASIL